MLPNKAFNLGDYPASAKWRWLREVDRVTRFATPNTPVPLDRCDDAGAGAEVVDEAERSLGATARSIRAMAWTRARWSPPVRR
jgi:hypothetical protein